MSYNDYPFSKENMDMYLKELAKEFRKINGKNIPAEIVLIGGASILANYGFREMTYDIDAIISASSAMKEAINRVGDRFNLANGWLNSDFTKTKSYSPNLRRFSKYYKTYSNILTIRTVSAEYLIAMKLMSGRKYKHDLSDVVGILLEHQNNGVPIVYEQIEKAIIDLYGSVENVSMDSMDFIRNVLDSDNLESLIEDYRKSEDLAKDVLLDFKTEYKEVLKDDNLDDILAALLNRIAESEMSSEEKDEEMYEDIGML